MPTLPSDAPVDLRVGDFEEFFVFGMALLVAIVSTAILLRGRRGWDLRFHLLVLAGSALCIVFEPALASVGGFWYATVGQNLGLIQLWGVTVGAHMLVLYYVFLGVTALFIVRYVRQGASDGDLFRLYGAIVALAIVLELPILFLTDVYTYYGANQPFFDSDWFPLPLWYPVLNGTLPFCMAMLAMLIASSGERWHLWLIPVLMPAYLFGIYFAMGWPALTVINTDVSKGVAYIGGLGTMGLSVLMMHFQSVALPRLARTFKLPEEVEAAPASAQVARAERRLA